MIRVGSAFHTSVTPVLACGLEFSRLYPTPQTASLYFPIRYFFLILLIILPWSSLTDTQFKQHSLALSPGLECLTEPWVIANPRPCVVFFTTVLPILSDPQSLEALPVQAWNRVLSLRKLGSGEPRPALGDSDSLDHLPCCLLSCPQAQSRCFPFLQLEQDGCTSQPEMSFSLVCRAPWWQPALESQNYWVPMG